jgi:hypothetical protein
MIPVVLVLFAACGLMFVSGGVPIEGDAQLAVFRTPLFIAMLGAVGALCVVACARYGRSWRRWPFWLVHLGAVVILLGAGLGKASSVGGRLALPVSPEHQVDAVRVPGQTGGVPLGFGLSVVNFRVDYYPPVYRVYRQAATKTGGEDSFEYEGEVAAGDDYTLRGKGIGLVGRDILWDAESGDWAEQRVLPDGRVLQRAGRTARHFEAVLSVSRDGRTDKHVLAVNRPVTVNGWRILLESYGETQGFHVLLALRNDPGRGYVIGGIWMVLLGIAAICWLPARRNDGCGCARPEERT